MRKKTSMTFILPRNDLIILQNDSFNRDSSNDLLIFLNNSSTVRFISEIATYIDADGEMQLDDSLLNELFSLNSGIF